MFPQKYLHKPWELKDEKILKLGSDYPRPIVKHEDARLKALKRLERSNLYISVAVLKFFS